MAYHGWFQLGGLEFANGPRAAAYARALVPQMAPKCKDCDTLAITLGDVEYTSPLIDQPDWFDHDNPDSLNFCGFYPLSVSGLEDDSRQASVIESTQSGGTVGRVRRATKEIRFTGLLIAADDSSLDLGLEWLKNVLNGNACRTPARGCSGDELCFLSACPDYVVGATDPDDPQVAHNVGLTIGWTTSSGAWVNGTWSPSSLPAIASGPEFNPPCDDVRYEWEFAPRGSEQVVRVYLAGDEGQRFDEHDVRLRRTNYLPNPTFRVNTSGWFTGSDVTLTRGDDHGVFTFDADKGANEIVGITSFHELPEQSPWSGRLTAALPETSPVGSLLVRPFALVDGSDLIGGDPVRLAPGASSALTVNGVQVDEGLSFGVQILEDAPAGTEILASHALLEHATMAGEYFDGTVSPDGYDTEWLGPDDNSRSRATRTAPVVTVAPNGSGPIRPVVELLRGTPLDLTEMTRYNREPADPEDCLEGVLRRMREVTCTSGPTIIERFNSCQLQGAMLRVEFTLTAGSPWIYHILPAEFTAIDPGTAELPADNGSGFHFEARSDVSSSPCEETEVRPLSDPDCPLPPPPPRPPVPAGCGVAPETYYRRAVGIPGDIMGQWQAGVPVVRLRTRTNTAVRQVRIRFHPNPLDRTNLDDLEECGYCGEFIVSYMPGNAELVIDGMTETATVILPGDRVRTATHLLFSSDGGPMVWPLLTCGIPYVMTLDTAPEGADLIASEMQIAVRS